MKKVSKAVRAQQARNRRISRLFNEHIAAAHFSDGNLRSADVKEVEAKILKLDGGEKIVRLARDATRIEVNNEYSEVVEARVQALKLKAYAIEA